MDTAELVTIINCLSTAANAKKGLASYEYQDKRIKAVEEELERRKLTRYNEDARRDMSALPG